MRTDWRILGTRCCIGYALRAAQVANLEEFILKFEPYSSPNTGGFGLDRRLVRAWDTGGRYISEGMVHRIDTRVPGTKIVYVIAPLLQQTCLSAPCIRRVVEPICAQVADGRLWKLPSLDLGSAARGVTTTYAWTDSASLVSRGDFPGFLAILALLRESVATRDLDCIKCYAQDLYTILPSVCSISWIRRDADLLLQCIEDMMVGVRWCLAKITIDWNTFRQQILNAQPWDAVPPWIVGCAGDFPGGRSWLKRPVPLLEGVVPLRPYVRHPDEVQRCSTNRPSGLARGLGENDRRVQAPRIFFGKPRAQRDDLE